MKWNLERFYPNERAEIGWEQDFERMEQLMAAGEREESASWAAQLWTYAYARWCLDTRDEIWEERTERVEEFESNHAEPEAEEHDVDEAVAAARRTQSLMMRQLREVRFDGLTLFQAMTSSDPVMRRRAYGHQNSAFERELDRYAALYAELNREPLRLDPAYRKARQGVVGRLPELQEYLLRCRAERGGEPLHWCDLSFLVDSSLHNWTPEYALLKTREMYGDMHPAWRERLNNLLEQGGLDMSPGLHKLQAGFSMPVPFHGEPLCYLHSVRGQEGVLGLVHELAHGLHFSTYRQQADNYRLPHVSVREVFPMAMELAALQIWEGEPAVWQRLLVSVLMQYIWTELKLRLHEEKAARAAHIQEVWDDLLDEVFGDALHLHRGTNRLWCGNRLLWEEAEVGQTYVCGGAAAWNLAAALHSGSQVAAVRIDEALALAPDATAADWSQRLGFDLFA